MSVYSHCIFIQFFTDKVYIVNTNHTYHKYKSDSERQDDPTFKGHPIIDKDRTRCYDISILDESKNCTNVVFPQSNSGSSRERRSTDESDHKKGKKSEKNKHKHNDEKNNHKHNDEKKRKRKNHSPKPERKAAGAGTGER